MRIQGRLLDQAVVYSIVSLFKMVTFLKERELIHLKRENVKEQESSAQHKEEVWAVKDQKENYEIILIR